MKKITMAVGACIVLALTAFGGVAIADNIRKEKLPRSPLYYEITNDGGDYGNYIELYDIPIPNSSRKVFCIVYSDKIGDGGGAGISCDWPGFHG
jgi:hypothetical protein